MTEQNVLKAAELIGERGHIKAHIARMVPSDGLKLKIAAKARLAEIVQMLFLMRVEP